MQFAGRYALTAPRMRVWEALNDVSILKACIRGCERIEWTSDSELEAAMKATLGPMALKIEGTLWLSDIIVAERYTLSGKGRAGWMGKARGSADVKLADHPDGTELAFVANGEVDSAIAQLGAAVVGGAAQGVIDRFFDRFAAAIGAGSTPLGHGARRQNQGD
jgi:carbon monoxide dehydrogenase subunit G